MANRSTENTSQGYVLCCGCRYFHECAVDSCKLVLRFVCFVSLLSPRRISCVYWKIFKFSAWNLQKVIWTFIRCHSKTISCNINDSTEKRIKQRIKVLTIGLEWNKCGRVTISVHFPKLKITLVFKFYLLNWWQMMEFIRRIGYYWVKEVTFVTLFFAPVFQRSDVIQCI